MRRESPCAQSLPASSCQTLLPGTVTPLCEVVWRLGFSEQAGLFCSSWLWARVLPMLMPPPARGVHGVSRGKITGMGWPHRHQVVLQTWCGCAGTSWACRHGSCETPPICCTSKLRNLIASKKEPSPLLPKPEQHVTAVAVTSDLCLCELVVAGSCVEV